MNNKNTKFCTMKPVFMFGTTPQFSPEGSDFWVNFRIKKEFKHINKNKPKNNEYQNIKS